VAQVDGKLLLLLLRVEDREGLSHLVPAYSSDGVTDWQIAPPAVAGVSPASWRTLSAARQLRRPLSRVLAADLACSA